MAKNTGGARGKRGRKPQPKSTEPWVPWAVQVRGEHGHLAWRFPRYEGEPAPPAARPDPQLDAEHEARRREAEEMRSRFDPHTNANGAPWLCDRRPPEETLKGLLTGAIEEAEKRLRVLKRPADSWRSYKNHVNFDTGLLSHWPSIGHYPARTEQVLGTLQQKSRSKAGGLRDSAAARAAMAGAVAAAALDHLGDPVAMFKAGHYLGTVRMVEETFAVRDRSGKAAAQARHTTHETTTEKYRKEYQERLQAAQKDCSLESAAALSPKIIIAMAKRHSRNYEADPRKAEKRMRDRIKPRKMQKDVH